MNELCELVACGLSPMDALVAATRNTADALGILGKTGTLEVGKSANLFVVKGDPIQHLSILASQESITLVMKDGKIARTSEGGNETRPQITTITK